MSFSLRRGAEPQQKCFKAYAPCNMHVVSAYSGLRVQNARIAVEVHGVTACIVRKKNVIKHLVSLVLQVTGHFMYGCSWLRPKTLGIIIEDDPFTWALPCHPTLLIVLCGYSHDNASKNNEMKPTIRQKNHRKYLIIRAL